jgi:hypothetical protein
LQLGVARQILKRAFFVFIKKMAIPDLSHNELAVGLQMGLEQLDAITAAIMDRNFFGRAQRRHLINGVKNFFILAGHFGGVC